VSSSLCSPPLEGARSRLLFAIEILCRMRLDRLSVAGLVDGILKW
jgi:hypothetical protein